MGMNAETARAHMRAAEETMRGARDCVRAWEWAFLVISLRELLARPDVALVELELDSEGDEGDDGFDGCVVDHAGDANGDQQLDSILYSCHPRAINRLCRAHELGLEAAGGVRHPDHPPAGLDVETEALLVVARVWGR